MVRIEEYTVRVIATEEFKWYKSRFYTGLSLSEYRALKEGKQVEIAKSIFKKNKHLKEVILCQ